LKAPTEIQIENVSGIVEADETLFLLYSEFYNKPTLRIKFVYFAHIGGNGFTLKIYSAMWKPSEFSASVTLKS
jgi:hypothetical protein